MEKKVFSFAKNRVLAINSTIVRIVPFQKSPFAIEFADPSHFVKYFKKNIGATPQAYRFAKGDTKQFSVIP